jgi:hypothetical protein
MSTVVYREMGKFRPLFALMRTEIQSIGTTLPLELACLIHRFTYGFVYKLRVNDSREFSRIMYIPDYMFVPFFFNKRYLFPDDVKPKNWLEKMWCDQKTNESSPNMVIEDYGPEVDVVFGRETPKRLVFGEKHIERDVTDVMHHNWSQFLKYGHTPIIRTYICQSTKVYMQQHHGTFIRVDDVNVKRKRVLVGPINWTEDQVKKVTDWIVKGDIEMQSNRGTTFAMKVKKSKTVKLSWCQTAPETKLLQNVEFADVEERMNGKYKPVYLVEDKDWCTLDTIWNMSV